MAAVTGDGGRKKSVKRTKGGLVPWWVRKRLQEQTQPEQEGDADVRSKPRKGRKNTHNIIEVGIRLPPLMPVSCHIYSYMPLVASWGQAIQNAEMGLCMSRWCS